jgi:hypothetical protein
MIIERIMKIEFTLTGFSFSVFITIVDGSFDVSADLES